MLGDGGVLVGLSNTFGVGVGETLGLTAGVTLDASIFFAY